MQKTIQVIMAACLVLGTTLAQAGWDPNLEQEALKTIEKLKQTNPGLEVFFEKAYGYAVFPTVGKGAIGIGGAHGTGVVFEQGKPIGHSKLTQLSIGFQLGGQTYSEIVFFEDKKTLDDFKKGNFEFSAQASAIAVKKGASTDADFDKGVAVFTLPKGGLMFEASIGGQKFSFEPKG